MLGKVVRTIVALVLLLLVAWVVSLLSVYIFSRKDEARRADAIVVLGAAQYNGRPSPVLQARLDHAVELFQDGLAPNMIVTGGVGVGDTVSEAEVGRRYAIRSGVPGELIFTENTGLSSLESMASVADFARTRNLDPIILVSDPFHMLRLKLLARRFDFQALSSPTRSSPITPGSREEWKYIVRESLILPFALLGIPSGAANP